MMRYHRVSPSFGALSNGRKSNLRVCKEDENGRPPNYTSTFEGKASLRCTNRSESSTSSTLNQEPNFSSNFVASTENRESSPSPNRGGDVLLQWGQHKRSRRSRVANEESSAAQSKQVVNIQRKVVEKQGITNHSMPPPPPPPPPSSPPCSSRSANLRSSMPSRDTTAALLNRNLEERPGLKNGSPSRNGGCSSSRTVSRSAPSPDNKAGSSSGTIKDEKPNGSVTQVDQMSHNLETTPLEQEVGGEKVNLDVFEWPRIYISLSRKEKEDDFMAMKGTKLPQRPKKRAKNVDKTLQYCFPGMWLSDLTRGRYEVREKKCVKKQKKRGLKGMESMDTDSE